MPQLQIAGDAAACSCACERADKYADQLLGDSSIM